MNKPKASTALNVNVTNEALTRLAGAVTAEALARQRLRVLQHLEGRKCNCFDNSDKCYLCEGAGLPGAQRALLDSQRALLDALKARGGAKGWVLTPRNGFTSDGTPKGGWVIQPPSNTPAELVEIIAEMGEFQALTDQEIRQYRFVGGASLRTTKRVATRYGYEQQVIS